MEQPKGSGLVRVRASLQFGDVNIATIEHNNQPHVVGKHVARALGYADDSAVSEHVASGDLRAGVHHEVVSGASLRPLKAAGVVGPRARAVTLLTERGLYRLLLLSKMPKALEFQDWVEGTLIPQAFRASAPPQVDAFDDRTEPRISAPKQIPPPLPPQLPAVRDPSQPGDQLRHRIRVAVVNAPLSVVVAMYEALIAVTPDEAVPRRAAAPAARPR